MTSSSEYKVEDRSLLLPYFKRFVVTPFVERLPSSVHPNTLTHLGHLIHLSGLLVMLSLRPTSGWPFFFAALCVQAHLLLDNADGAHARKTGQCSPLGELLDHGLDSLNVAYIGYNTALSMGLPTSLWMPVVLTIASAASFTLWEQASTGYFRLGLLNQVESLIVLSLALCVSGIFGTHIWQIPIVGPYTSIDLMLAWILSTMFFGMLRGVVRTLRDAGKTPAPAILSLTVFTLSLAALAYADIILWPLVLLWGSSAHVCFSIRMLNARMQHAPISHEPWVTFSAALVLLLLLSKHFSVFSSSPHSINSVLQVALPVTMTLILSARALFHATVAAKTITSQNTP